MRGFGICFAVLFLALPASTWAANWWLILTGDGEDVFFIDEDSIVVTGGERSYWLMQSKPEPDDNGFWFLMSRRIFDCRQRTETVTFISGYDEELARIASQRVRNYGSKPIVPSTYAERMLEFVCADSGNRGALQAGSRVGENPQSRFNMMEELMDAGLSERGDAATIAYVVHSEDSLRETYSFLPPATLERLAVIFREWGPNER